MSGIISVCLSSVSDEKQLGKSLNCIERASCEVGVFVCDHSRNEMASEKLQWANPAINVLFRKKKTRYTVAVNSIPSDLLGKYLIVMDPGITFKPELLSRMIAYMEVHPSIAVLSPLFTDQKGIELSVPRRELSIRNLFSMAFSRISGSDRSAYKSLTMTDRVVDAPVSVKIASSRFMFIRTEVFSRLGGFDPGYDRFLADCDLCQRILTTHAGSIVWHPHMTVVQDSVSGCVDDSIFRKLISTVRYAIRWRIRW